MEVVIMVSKIKVSETNIPEKDIQADASSIKYSLVKILDEQKDNRFLIHDIWVAKKIFGKDFTTNLEAPNLEINVTQMKIHGKDGCNVFNGGITVLKGNNIEFGPLMATRKYCGEENISSQFNKALHQTKSYKREGLTLVLLNERGDETLRLLKVD